MVRVRVRQHDASGCGRETDQSRATGMESVTVTQARSHTVQVGLEPGRPFRGLAYFLGLCPSMLIMLGVPTGLFVFNCF